MSWFHSIVIPILLTGAPAEAVGEQVRAAAESPDFRGRVVLAYGLVVVVIVLFVTWATSRDRKALEDVEDLEERVSKLEREQASSDAS